MSCDYYQNQLSPSGYISIPSDWGTCLINMLRVHIGDFTDPPQYTDERLFQVISAAAYYVVVDIDSCPIEHPMVECDGSMSENPLSYPGFVNLVILKSACIIDRGMVRQRLLMEGVRASCGPALIQVTSSSSVYQTFFQYGACAAYNELKEQLCFRDPVQSANFARQVVSLFISDYYKPRWTCGGPDEIRRIVD